MRAQGQEAIRVQLLRRSLYGCLRGQCSINSRASWHGPGEDSFFRIRLLKVVLGVLFLCFS